MLGWAGMRGVVTLAAAFVIPDGHRAPRGAAADRVHRRGRHAVHPGPVAALAGPPPAGARRRTRSRTRWPGPPAPAGVQGGLQGARRAGVRRPAGRRRADPAAHRAAQLRGLGAARHRRRPGVAQRPLRPGPARDDRRRAGPGARDPRRRHGRQRGGRRGAGACSTSRSRCWTSPPRRAARSSGTTAAARRTGDTLRRPRRATRSSRPPRSRSASDCLRRGYHVGRAAPVPRVRQHRLLRLLTRPPRHRALPRVPRTR